ncbi:MAG: murein biosynthesis integral membrane protein MurJ [Gemmatimonadetes bacterium]|nr:murein biosynthesis integral membrane protein MurJ [Gemmatimonadota bacterium]NNM03512.1 murein biosynthesis integral membrane protein MurJ [Gemmatimonadota bacterium]
MTKRTDPKGEHGSGARAAIWVGAGIFLSKIAGLFREQVFAYYFGASAVADVWRVALRTPNVIQNLLGEGTLSASLIPVYAEFLEQGREEEAGRFAGATLGILATVAFGLALVGILLAPVVIPVVFWKWDPWMQELAITVVRILFPMTAVLVVSAWALGILNSHRRFFVSYVAPVAWNLGLITAMVGTGSYLGWDAMGRDAEMAVALAWGALAGGVLQLLVQTPWLLPHLAHFRLSLGRRVAGVREAIRNFAPVVAARGVVNVSGWLDMFLAHLLVFGAPAMLGYAQTLYLLPIGIFGMAIAASELPELSRKRGEVEAVLVPRVRNALERLWFLLIPSALAYLVLGDVFVAALFERGEFGPDTTMATYAVLAAYSLGLPASASSRALSSTFYALRDTRTPAVTATLRVVLSVVLGASLMFPLDRLAVGDLRLGAAGLALGSAAGAWLEYIRLRRKLATQLGPHGPPAGRAFRVLLAGLVGAAAGFGAKQLLGFSADPGILGTLLGDSSFWVNPLAAVGTALAFGVAYMGAASLLGVGMPIRKSAPQGN